MDDFPTATEAAIARWFSVSPPNDPGRRMVADLTHTIAAFEKLRGTMVFEDEPSSFEAALQATKETGV
ncbi:MAG: hypothetical protein WCI94_11670 [Rhodospirillales bacterium]